MKKIISVLLAAVMLVSSVLAFSSCGKVSASKDLDKVKAAGKLVVGMECAYAPYNWAQPTSNENTVKLSNGTYADGYDVQIAKKIVPKVIPFGTLFVKYMLRFKQVRLFRS